VLPPNQNDLEMAEGESVDEPARNGNGPLVGGRGAGQGAMPCPAAVSYGTIVFINDWISDGESARL